MQPDRKQPDDWQQPSAQPSQAPYAAVPADPSSRPAPVVTLTSDVSSQPTAAAETPQKPMSSTQTPPSPDEPVRWQAHEYIYRDKNPLWFVVFVVVMVGLMAFSIFVIQSITFTILIPVMAVALLVYTRRPPRVLDYTVSQKGLHINDRLYPFTDFKGFGVIREGKEYSVMLIPIKRFRLGVSVYFPEETGEAIVDMLGTHLPMQELHLDLVDQLIRKLRI
jgi:hypothetical protein